MFESFINDFHWLRPTWLLLAPAASLLVFLLWRLQQSRNNWQAYVDEKLLPLLLDGQQTRQTRLPFVALALSLIISALAMAGPSWEKIPQPVHKTESALVIILDLSPSMLAEDLKPSRLVRTRLKLIDLLKQRQEGLTALIVYAGESHVVTPLTDDTETIIGLLPSLTPNIMPLRGSNPEMAIDQALTLLSDAGLSSGELLLATDGVADEAADYIEAQLNDSTRLSILGIGSEEGAPIPAQNGGFSKNRKGGIVISKLNGRQLQSLASTLGGRYSALRTDNRDIEYLLETPALLDEQTRELNREFDTWQDRGPWLTLLLLPFALLAFRRGWVLSIGLVGFISFLPAQDSYAQQSGVPAAVPSTEPDTSIWKDLWQTRDQQAQALLPENAGQAANTFKNPNWRASAHYRAGNFTEAAQAFSEDRSSTGHYNQGNALAKAGQLEDAKAAYQEALKQQEKFPAAESNLALIEELLKQQQEQDSQEQQNSEDQQSSDQQSSENDGQQSDEKSEQSSEQSSDEQPAEQNENQSNEQEDSKDAPEQENADAAEQEKPSEEESQKAAEEAKEQAAQGDESNEENQGTPTAADALSEEQRQAMEQWLRQVPDDPSGLIRRKFEHQYRQRKEAYRSGSWQPPENQANERW